MGNLFTSLFHTAGSMSTFERAIQVVQGNVTNASTPGYAKQRLSLLSKHFQLEAGLPGGVDAGEMTSSRSRYAEEAVWRQQENFGFSAYKQDGLARIEASFDITGNAGIPGGISRFFQTISTLAVTPNDTAARQAVLDRATDLAATFRETATGLARSSLLTQSETQDLVKHINVLTTQVREINVERRKNFQARDDAGLDARMHSVLEELSELVNFTTLEAEDGTLGVYLGGEATLVIGDRQYMLDTDFSTSQTALRLNGSDVTRMARAGRLGATLEVSNRFIPGYLADLDVLAQSFADSVNNTLAAGLDANGQPPVNPLFTTDPMTSAAATLDVSPLVPGELAVAANGAPGGNGNALALGSLVASKVVGGYTFAEYYGTIAARAGRELDAARETAHTQEALVTQARALRAEISGVSLDEEAAFLLQFQRAYQASARVFTTIDEMTETIIGLLR